MSGVVFILVVPNIKDINFWEQFTTMSKPVLLPFSCSEYQRYQLLRAIHNASGSPLLLLKVVPNIKDINFWEQFTTRISVYTQQIRLFRISKISTFESNSQHLSRFTLFSNVVPNIKDINFWEQFTTDLLHLYFLSLLFRISKISTFESNSQLIVRGRGDPPRCSEYQRYQLLRAIHN